MSGSPSEPRRIASAALGRPVEYLLYRPVVPAPCPLVLVLHGADASPPEIDGHVGGALAGVAAAEPVIIAAPAGDNGWWLDSPRARWQTFLAGELIPAIAAEHPIAGVGAVGYSMGGQGAIGLALAHPDRVRAAASMSGALDLLAAANRVTLQALLGPLDADRAAWEARSVAHRLAADPPAARRIALRLDCGSADPWLATNRAVHAQLERLGIEHTYGEQPGGHDWTYWAAMLPAQVAWVARVIGAALRTRHTAW